MELEDTSTGFVARLTSPRMFWYGIVHRHAVVSFTTQFEKLPITIRWSNGRGSTRELERPGRAGDEREGFLPRSHTGSVKATEDVGRMTGGAGSG